MTVFEYAPDKTQILDFINDGIRNLQEGGKEPKYILVGPTAYDVLIAAISERFNRTEGSFETYQFIPIVLDPLRQDTVCVLPSPLESRSIDIYQAPGSS